MSRFSAVIKSTNINGAVGRRYSLVLNEESLSTGVFVDEGGRVMAMMLKVAVMWTSSSSPLGNLSLIRCGRGVLGPLAVL